MPEINTKLFTEDSILSEFTDPLDSPTLIDIPANDLPQISLSHVTTTHIDNCMSSSSTTIPECPKATPIKKPNRKLIEKPIQPNFIVENADNKIRYIQKPGIHSLVPIQNVRQIHLPPDQMKQVLQYLFYFCIL